MSTQRGISLKAVLFGFLVDLICSLGVGVAIGVVLGGMLLAQGATPDELNAQMQEPVVLVPSLAVGLACTVLGGFVAGHFPCRPESIDAKAIAEALEPHFATAGWEEVIPLAAVLASSVQKAEPLIMRLSDACNGGLTIRRAWPRRALRQCLLDEVPLKSPVLRAALREAAREGIASHKLNGFFLALLLTKFEDVVRGVIEDAYLDNSDHWDDYLSAFSHLHLAAWHNIAGSDDSEGGFNHPRIEGDRHQIARRLSWFASPVFPDGILDHLPPENLIHHWLEIRASLLPVLEGNDEPLVLLACILLSTLSRFERLRAFPPKPSMIQALYRWWRSPRLKVALAAAAALAHQPLLPRDALPHETWGDCDGWLRKPDYSGRTIDAMSLQAAFVVAWYRRAPWTDEQLAEEISKRSAARLNSPTARELLANLGQSGAGVLNLWEALDQEDNRRRSELDAGP